MILRFDGYGVPTMVEQSAIVIKLLGTKCGLPWGKMMTEEEVEV